MITNCISVGNAITLIYFSICFKSLMTMPNGIEWNVHVRIVPNKNGSTTTWIFTRPDELSEEEFEAQLNGFDSEIAGWKSALGNMTTIAEVRHYHRIR